LGSSVWMQLYIYTFVRLNSKPWRWDGLFISFLLSLSRYNSTVQRRPDRGFYWAKKQCIGYAGGVRRTSPLVEANLWDFRSTRWGKGSHCSATRILCSSQRWGRIQKVVKSVVRWVQAHWSSRPVHYVPACKDLSAGRAFDSGPSHEHCGGSFCFLSSCLHRNTAWDYYPGDEPPWPVPITWSPLQWRSRRCWKIRPAT
jgi:hypothetical protein